VLVLRDETERPEAIQAGCAQIVGAKRANIVNAVRRLMSDELAYRRMHQSISPFGNGSASAQIVRRLEDDLCDDAEHSNSTHELRTGAQKCG
jgi:UDP-N-acetylglucosamine 2-epimerase (non-hydrolysing)